MIAKKLHLVEIMGLFDFLHKPKQNTKNSIEQVASNQNKIKQQYNDTILYGARLYGSFRHSDGTMSDLISASVIEPTESGTYIFNNQKYICFEVPHGRNDLIQKMVSQLNEIRLPYDRYTYVGRAYDEYDIRMQPPTATVNRYVEELNKELQAQIQQEKIRWQQKEQERLEAEKIRRAKEQEKYAKEMQAYRNEMAKNINNPTLKDISFYSNDNVKSYNGTDMKTGEVLRIRGMQLKDSDLQDYIYTASISTTPNETDAELLTSEIGVPVVFTLPSKMEEMLANQNPNQRQIFIKSILTLLSQGYYNHLLSDGKWDTRILHDIGGIDKDGKIYPHIRGKAQENLINKITKLQREYYSKKQAREDQDR